MMAGLFFLFLVTEVLIFLKKRPYAMVLALITIFLCFGMLIHHATDTLQVRL